eukprot:m.187823 g.187823  ORF g.187823 m.187823 type:complete len:576 (+) comp18512_c0_seq3:262-1989(+)
MGSCCENDPYDVQHVDPICEKCGMEMKHDHKICRACGSIPHSSPYAKRKKTFVPTRQYQMHQGKNTFFCWGRVITGGDLAIVIVTWTLLVVTIGIFFAFPARYLWTDISPSIPILIAFLTIFTFSSLIHASWTDPGIIPRGEELEARRDNGDLPRLKPTKVLHIDYRLKYCHSCEMYRPPRVSHCSRCDNCIEKFDHHCPWLGNCVGIRNYRYFFTFVVCITLLCASVFSSSVAHLASLAEDRSFKGALKGEPATVYCAIMTLIFGLTTLRLLVFHVYLLSRGLTTNEELCHTYGGDAPFNEGFLTNFKKVMLGPRLTGRLEPRRALQQNGAPRNRPLRKLLAAQMEDDAFDDDEIIADVSAEEEYAERLRMRESRQSLNINGTPPLLGGSSGGVPFIEGTNADDASCDLEDTERSPAFRRTENLLAMQSDTKFSAVSALSFGDMDFGNPKLSTGAGTDDASMSSRQPSLGSLGGGGGVAAQQPHRSVSAFVPVPSTPTSKEEHMFCAETPLAADSPESVGTTPRRPDDAKDLSSQPLSRDTADLSNHEAAEEDTRSPPKPPTITSRQGLHEVML